MALAGEPQERSAPPPRPTVGELVSDLAAEHRSLDDIVADLPAEGWARMTPSVGWSVADQIGHLAFFDRAAGRSIAGPAAFADEVAGVVELIRRGIDPGEEALSHSRSLDHVGQLAEWRDAREALLAAAGGLTDSARVPWYGPSMGAISFLSARLMETWAHGEDVAAALDAERPATDRLRHVAQLGVITRSWSYAVRGASAPADLVRVRLHAPSGAFWEWHSGADQSIEGEALDFCRVVTQRRHVADTGLALHGDAAASWMHVAQAFAGAPTEGPLPGG